MMLLVAIALLLLQFLAGFGLLRVSKAKVRPCFLIPVSVLLGLAFFSFVPFLLQLLHIPVTAINIATGIGLPILLMHRRPGQSFHALKKFCGSVKFRVRFYELPFLLVIIALVLISAWRCFYLPPTPRDLTSGPEVIAEYTVKEKTMVNSVFTVNLESTNNQFKSPFIASLQVIYKYAGFPFGQVWLSTTVILFIVFLYHALSLRIHRLLAGLLLLFFTAVPEMYAYTFMVLFDYSNAVYFCLALYFLFQFPRNKKNMVLSGLLMGIAVYIRSETLVLTVLFFPFFLWYASAREKRKSLLKATVYFYLPSVLLYFLSVTIYIRYYLPVHYDISALVNHQLLHVKPLFKRFADVNGELLFSDTGINYYGYFLFFFLMVLLADIFFIQRWKPVQVQFLFGILVVYAGLPLLGFLLPLMDLHNSTKRGLFKLFPLLLLYLSESTVMRSLSLRLKQWEFS